MAKNKSTGGGLSLRTADATAGGGTEGALATLTEIGFVDEFTYGGRHKDKPQAALEVEFTIDGFDKPWNDNFTIGPSDRYEVIEDGDGIKSLGKSTGLNKNCKAHLFFAAVEKAAAASGLDIDELLPEIDGGGHSVAPLRGRRVRLTNVEFETVGGETKEAVVIGAFEEDEPTKGKSKNGSKSVSSSKKSSGEDIEEKVEKTITELLDERTSVKKGDLGNLIYQSNKKDPDAKAMMQYGFKDAWLADEDRPWTLDKKKGILKAKTEEDDD